MNIDVRRDAPNVPERQLFSCATPQHEALEAFRWMRELLASGKARPEEIAIAAASPTDFDDDMLALSGDANIPIHFVHGVKAVTTRDGQTAAALAEVLIKGISQERVRRLFALLHGASKATCRSSLGLDARLAAGRAAYDRRAMGAGVRAVGRHRLA